jgi:hypothetical protein
MRIKKKRQQQLGVVAHTCNPSYLGGKGKRIRNSETAEATQQDLVTKAEQKGLGCDPGFNP